mmetsp:Transcript_14919/g.38677  ORF Transcript_14919/g.38677 Transcript_14919/m.38677 type:complete len:82 (+) Transcript_14919:148-393(+)
MHSYTHVQADMPRDPWKCLNHECAASLKARLAWDRRTELTSLSMELTRQPITTWKSHGEADKAIDHNKNARRNCLEATDNN